MDTDHLVVARAVKKGFQGFHVAHIAPDQFHGQTGQRRVVLFWQHEPAHLLSIGDKLFDKRIPNMPAGAGNKIQTIHNPPPSTLILFIVYTEFV